MLPMTRGRVRVREGLPRREGGVKEEPPKRESGVLVGRVDRRETSAVFKRIEDAIRFHVGLEHLSLIHI